jgi:hypothetical protein
LLIEATVGVAVGVAERDVAADDGVGVTTTVTVLAGPVFGAAVHAVKVSSPARPATTTLRPAIMKSR